MIISAYSRFDLIGLSLIVVVFFRTKIAEIRENRNKLSECLAVRLCAKHLKSGVGKEWIKYKNNLK